MLKALIFDMDGTLSETEELHRLAFNRTFAEFNLGWDWTKPLYRELLSISGGKERMRDYSREFGNPISEELLAEAHAAKTAHYGQLVQSDHLELRSGVKALLEAARDEGLKLAIATTSVRLNVERLCQSCFGTDALSIFDVVSTSDCVKHKKPAPDLYEYALESLGLDTSECIAIEDSRVGLLSAKAANLRCVVVPGYYTTGGDFHEADVVVDGFEVIPTGSAMEELLKKAEAAAA